MDLKSSTRQKSADSFGVIARRHKKGFWIDKLIHLEMMRTTGMVSRARTERGDDDEFQEMKYVSLLIE